MVSANVRELFSLEPSEDIFDDFNCKDGALAAGRMYLTSAHLCFYRSVLGISKKIKLNWMDVTEVTGKGAKEVVISRKTEGD